MLARTPILALVLLLGGCPLSRDNDWDPTLCGSGCPPGQCLRGTCLPFDARVDAPAIDAPATDAPATDAPAIDAPTPDRPGDRASAEAKKDAPSKPGDVQSKDSSSIDKPGPDQPGKLDHTLGADKASGDLLAPNTDGPPPVTGCSWSYPAPQGNNLNKVWVHAATGKAVAVGAKGMVLFWDGTSWKVQDAGTREELRGVWGNDPNDVYVVGGDSNGVVLHYNGVTWSVPSKLSNVSGYILRDVWTASGKVYIVGGSGGGVVVWFDGSVWQTAVLGSVGLYGVSGRSWDEVYAVGDNVMHKYDGASWVSPGSPCTGLLRAVADIGSASGEHVLMVVGESGTACKQVNINGGWSTIAPPTPSPKFRGVWGTGGKAVATANLGLYVYDGATWGLSSSDANFISVGGVSLNDYLAVGYNGAVSRFQPSQTVVLKGDPRPDIYGLWMASATEAFAVGAKGTILHLQNGTWTNESQSAGVTFHSVWGTSPSDVFAVGEGSGDVIFHRNGTGWSPMVSPFGASPVWLYGVWGTGPSNVYAVGAANTASTRVIIRYTGGTDWNLTTTSGGALKSVWGSGAGDIYAAGDQTNPVVHSSNGGAPWLNVGAAKAMDYRAVHGDSSGHIAFAALNSAFVHDGSSLWNEIALLTPLYGLWVNGKIYGAADKGELLIVDTAQQVKTQASSDFRAVTGHAPSGVVLVGGTNGSILRCQ